MYAYTKVRAPRVGTAEKRGTVSKWVDKNGMLFQRKKKIKRDTVYFLIARFARQPGDDNRRARQGFLLTSRPATSIPSIFETHLDHSITFHLSVHTGLAPWAPYVYFVTITSDCTECTTSPFATGRATQIEPRLRVLRRRVSTRKVTRRSGQLPGSIRASVAHIASTHLLSITLL